MVKTFLIVFILIFTFIASYAQQGWVQRSSGTGNALYSVQFINTGVGFACGVSGTFLKTTNGGVNWSLFQLNYGTLRQVQFLNANTGFVSSDSGIITTMNSGANWFRIFNNPQNGSLLFLNNNTGYVIFGICYKTTNGGGNWQQLGFLTDQYAPGFIYLNDTTMYASGGSWTIMFGGLYMAQIYKSTNGGANWTTPYTSGFNSGGAVVNDISFPSLSNGYGIGYEGYGNNYFYKSTNYSLNWTKNSIQSQMYSLYFYDNNTGWTVGTNGVIDYSTNGGVSFYHQNSGVTTTLRKIFMLNNTTGWIVGDNGVILSTTNGGITFIEPIGSNIPSIYKLYQNYPNPFNPVTKIKFDVAPPLRTNGAPLPLSGGDVPALAGTVGVKIVIYDALGREAAKLVNEQLNPGTYETDWPATGGASNYPSGVYFYKLVVGDNTNNGGFVQTKKMVLIK